MVGRALSAEDASGPELGDPVAGAARLYLSFLPIGHIALVPLGGAMATATDLALGGLLAAGIAAAGASRLGGVAHRAALLPAGFTRGVLLLVAFGGWAACSGLWGYHPRYAVLKGAAYVALAGGAWLLARSAWDGKGSRGRG